MAIDRRIRIGDWLLPYDDATVEVILDRTVEDILRATPGDDRNCMNSMCIRAQRNAHCFPHPVYLVSTITSRVYIVDRLTDTNTPAHAIRYELSEHDSRLIAAHDRAGVGEPGKLRLRIPRDPKGSPKRAASTTAGRFSTTAGRYSGDGKATRSKPVTSLGAAHRYVVAVGAGLVNNGG
jgi:hypothetical protein